MRSWPAPPAGFALLAEGRRALYVDAELATEPSALALGSWEGWSAAPDSSGGSIGRGPTAVVPGAGGMRWRLKRMRRGGRLAPLWRGRYPSPKRLVGTLSASVEARARGIATPRPVALFVERGGIGLVRGAMAFEEIEGADDLASLVTRGAVTEGDLGAAMDAVRTMHDRGMVHPDLNLGNVLVRGAGAPRPEVLVIDLDGARLLDNPAPFECRQAAVRRMERSCAKLTGAPGPLGPGSEDLWYALYARGDSALARGFARSRGAGRLALALHRAGWKRRPS